MLKIVKIMVIALLGASLALSFGAGCALGTRTPAGSTQGLDVVGEAWNIIFQDYVERDRLDASQMSQAAIEGMVKALDDPYTSYLDPETYQLTLSSLEGKFEGIGAQVTIENDQIMVIAPIADSPADRAGIRAGDVILEIDGKSTAGMSLAEAVALIRGPRGTSVRLRVLHQGETEPQEIEIVRAEIELTSVRFEMRQDIAYINITYFSQDTDEELSPVLDSITGGAATGIILDLRSNPGGILTVVVDVASHFLREGVVVDVVDNQGVHTPLAVEHGRVTTDLPLVGQ